VCPCTTLLVDKDIEYRVHVSQANIFVCDASNAAKFARVKSKCPSITTVIQVDGVLSPGSISYHEQMSQIPQNEVFPSARLSVSDPCMIYFTSGTTGLPKMVLHNQISYPLGRFHQSLLLTQLMDNIAHTISGKRWLRLSPGKLYWNLSEQGSF
jgi:medium-chain acyl-CoA synthetase